MEFLAKPLIIGKFMPNLYKIFYFFIFLILNRMLFCEKYIVPRTTTAGKYISLYRKIRDQGFYIADMNPELRLPQIKDNNLNSIDLTI